MHAQVKQWGNSLALRVPKPLADEAGLVDGSEVHLTFTDGRLVVEPAKRYRLADLLAGVTDENLHAAIDDGPSVGHEEW
jgi:antitoxin MazE